MNNNENHSKLDDDYFRRLQKKDLIASRRLITLIVLIFLFVLILLFVSCNKTHYKEVILHYGDKVYNYDNVISTEIEDGILHFTIIEDKKEIECYCIPQGAVIRDTTK